MKEPRLCLQQTFDPLIEEYAALVGADVARKHLDAVGPAGIREMILVERRREADAAADLTKSARERQAARARLDAADRVRAGETAPTPSPEPAKEPSAGPPQAPGMPARAPSAGAPAKVRKALPSRLDDPGLTVVTDSGLPPLIGHTATAVWLCLLRHANGRPGRLVTGIGYREIAHGTGLTKQQIRDSLAVLLTNADIVQRTKEGRTRDGTKLTSEYVIHFPTVLRLERWRIRLAGTNADSTPSKETA